LFCQGLPELLFTDNETNTRRLYNYDNGTRHTKDGINEFIVHGARDAVNRDEVGTKAAAHYPLTIGPGETRTIRLRLTDLRIPPAKSDPFNGGFEKVFSERQREADEFYDSVIPAHLSEDAKKVMRQALGGLLWSKQFYYYDLRSWLKGDPAGP